MTQRRRRWFAAAALLALALGFVALGQWQLQRRLAKHALLAQIAAGQTLPPLSHVPAGAGAPLAYRRLHLAGHYRADALALVAASTELGAGYWELVPLVPRDGATVVINRGFVALGTNPATARAAVPRGTVEITGYIRLTEPDGTLLRANHPAQDRWYSRDAAVICARRAMACDPRLFVDAITESPPAPTAPAMGLTRLTFPDNHLVYALTWFALAGLSLGGLGVLWREGR